MSSNITSNQDKLIEALQDTVETMASYDASPNDKKKFGLNYFITKLKERGYQGIDNIQKNIRQNKELGEILNTLEGAYSKRYEEMDIYDSTVLNLEDTIAQDIINENKDKVFEIIDNIIEKSESKDFKEFLSHLKKAIQSFINNIKKHLNKEVDPLLSEVLIKSIQNFENGTAAERFRLNNDFKFHDKSMMKFIKKLPFPGTISELSDIEISNFMKHIGESFLIELTTAGYNNIKEIREDFEKTPDSLITFGNVLFNIYQDSKIYHNIEIDEGTNKVINDIIKYTKSKDIKQFLYDFQYLGSERSDIKERYNKINYKSPSIDNDITDSNELNVESQNINNKEILGPHTANVLNQTKNQGISVC